MAKVRIVVSVIEAIPAPSLPPFSQNHPLGTQIPFTEDVVLKQHEKETAGQACRKTRRTDMQVPTQEP
jgi:hypothetical protein